VADHALASASADRKRNQMHVKAWIDEELADAEARLAHQVLRLVPARQRGETPPGGGNSIAWTLFHLARHAELAVAVLTGDPPRHHGGDGLQETEHPVDVGDAGAHAQEILAAARAVLPGVDLDARPDAAGMLRRSGVPHETFSWLYEQWEGQPAAFFVRWPLVGHVQNHLGEAIATRNRLGLSPHA